MSENTRLEWAQYCSVSIPHWSPWCSCGRVVFNQVTTCTGVRHVPATPETPSRGCRRIHYRYPIPTNISDDDEIIYIPIDQPHSSTPHCRMKRSCAGVRSDPAPPKSIRWRQRSVSQAARAGSVSYSAVFGSHVQGFIRRLQFAFMNKPRTRPVVDPDIRERIDKCAS